MTYEDNKYVDLDARHTELALSLAAGDKRAETLLFTENTKLVYPVVKRYSHPKIEAADLEQEGMVGLLVAVRTWKPGAGMNFRNWATREINKHVQRSVDRLANAVVLPENVGTLRGRARKLMHETEASTGMPMTMEAVAVALGKDLRLVQIAVAAPVAVHVAIDTTRSHRTEQRDRLTMPQPREAQHADSYDQVEAAHDASRDVMWLLGQLTPKQAQMLTLRWGLDGLGARRLKDIAETMGLDAYRTSQLEARTMEIAKKLMAERAGAALETR